MTAHHGISTTTTTVHYHSTRNRCITTPKFKTFQNAYRLKDYCTLLNYIRYRIGQQQIAAGENTLELRTSSLGSSLKYGITNGERTTANSFSFKSVIHKEQIHETPGIVGLCVISINYNITNKLT